MKGKFVDEHGEIVLAFSSSSNLISIIPKGFNVEDIQPLTKGDEMALKLKVEADANKPDPKDKRIDDLTTQLTMLQADVDKIKKQK